MYRKKYRKAFTLVELMVVAAILVVVMAVIMPQFHALRKTWATTERSSAIIQNAMVLSEHINRNLSTASQIVSVSPGSTVSGFITFKNNLGVTKKYMVSNGYIVFGEVGSEEQLAGPVGRFQINCYSLDDFNTPTTDVNNIRLVEIETDIETDQGTSKTFATSVYLQTNTNAGCGLAGQWKLDESSGTTAADSSSSSNDGTLYSMSSPGCWTTGQIGNALDFDGNNDYVSLPIGSVVKSLTNCTITSWVNWSGLGNSWQRIWDFGTGETRNMFLTVNNSYSNTPRFSITTGGWSEEDQTTAPSDLSANEWHHIAVTIDADNHTHKLYIDGSLVAQNTSAYLDPNSLGTTNYNYLGRSNYSADPYFNGMIDDVRIYNRVLSASEIADLANTLKYMGFDENTSSTTSVVIPVPTGTSNGDLLIAAVAANGSTTLSTPSGWTSIDQGTNGSAVTLGAWYKIAGSSEPASYTFSWSGSRSAYGWMMRFTGQNGTPINASADGQSSGTANPTSPAVTATVDNCIILRLGAFDSGDITADDPGLHSPIDHTAITMNSSGSSNVALLGSWTTGTTHAKAAGNNRALVFTAHARRSGVTSLTSVTYGGQAMTKIVEAIHGTGNPRVCTSTYILDDAGIDAATTTTFTPTWSSAPSSVAYSSVFLQNVNQSTPTGASAGNATTSGLTITTSSLATSAGNIVIEAGSGSATGSFTTNNGFNEVLELTISSADGVVGYKSATGANETPSVTHSSATRKSLVGFVVNGMGTVSGGAGYVKQSTAGSSGTSNFSLGSSNNAMMITIAIAPASTGSEDCSGGQITP